MLEVKNINKSYGSLHVLRDINLTINQGEVVSVVGASGAGKTTLLQILGTLDRADSGVLQYDDIDVNAWRLLAYQNIWYHEYRQKYYDNGGLGLTVGAPNAVACYWNVDFCCLLQSKYHHKHKTGNDKSQHSNNMQQH